MSENTIIETRSLQTIREHARNLFICSNYSQSEIAGMVGVSQKTISVWASEGKWAQFRQSMSQSPTIVMLQLQNELTQLNNRIASRPEGDRFPTSEESDIRRKIIATIKSVNELTDASVGFSWFLHFFEYIHKQNPEHASLLVTYADEYLIQKAPNATEPFSRILSQCIQ